MISTSVLFGVRLASHDEGAPDTTEYGILVSPSVVLALASHLKAVGEVHMFTSEPRDGAWVAALRVPGGKYAVDLGAMGDLRSGELAPAGSLTVRW
jgi:hypothetical protein